MGNYDVGPFKQPTPGPRKRSTTDLGHQSGKDFTGPGNQKPQVVWDSGIDAASIGKVVGGHAPTTAIFQRTRNLDRFTKLDSFDTEYHAKEKVTNTRVQKDVDDLDER